MQFILGLIFTSCILAVFAYDCDPGSCMKYETCCQTHLPGVFMCCPYKDGVCCKDQEFCCPKNTVCDIITATCQPLEVNLQELDHFEKRQGVPAEETPFFQNFCDDWSFCPYGYTCCISVDGTYGCCPYMHATCCPDKIHCCPQNEQCDATSEYCIRMGINFPSATKEPTIPINDESLL